MASASTTTVSSVTEQCATSRTSVQAVAAKAMRASRAALARPRRVVAVLPSPVRPNRLDSYLSGYTPQLRSSLVRGFTHGFRIISAINVNSCVNTGRGS